MNRRSWLQTALGALAWRGLSRLSAASSRLTWETTGTLEVNLERQYRADAQVLLLGLPILHREGVGSGRASWMEWREGIRQLEFTGFSIPERAAGLKRFGFIRERSRYDDDGPPQSIYIGLMTASPEESAGDAKKALHSQAKDALYTAIEGRATPDGENSATVHFIGPAHLAEWSSLEAQARQLLSAAPIQPAAFKSGQQALQPFLHALTEAIHHFPEVATQYRYGGHVYDLSLRQMLDTEATTEFRKRKLLPETGQAMRVSGTLQRKVGGKPIDFRLWVEKDVPRPIPLRIDYRAKSYLRLTFEAV